MKNFNRKYLEDIANKCYFLTSYITVKSPDFMNCYKDFYYLGKYNNAPLEKGIHQESVIVDTHIEPVFLLNFMNYPFPAGISITMITDYSNLAFIKERLQEIPISYNLNEKILQNNMCILVLTASNREIPYLAFTYGKNSLFTLPVSSFFVDNAMPLSSKLINLSSSDETTQSKTISAIENQYQQTIARLNRYLTMKLTKALENIDNSLYITAIEFCDYDVLFKTYSGVSIKNSIPNFYYKKAPALQSIKDNEKLMSFLSEYI